MKLPRDPAFRRIEALDVSKAERRRLIREAQLERWRRNQPPNLAESFDDAFSGMVTDRETA